MTAPGCNKRKLEHCKIFLKIKYVSGMHNAESTVALQQEGVRVCNITGKHIYI